MDNLEFSLPDAQKPLIDQEDDVSVLTHEPVKVILYNDDVHTFDEVIGQLIKAIRCDSQKAETLAWQVHNHGKAVVFQGLMRECLQTSAVLEEIALHTQIEV